MHPFHFGDEKNCKADSIAPHNGGELENNETIMKLILRHARVPWRSVPITTLFQTHIAGLRKIQLGVSACLSRHARGDNVAN